MKSFQTMALNDYHILLTQLFDNCSGKGDTQNIKQSKKIIN